MAGTLVHLLSLKNYSTISIPSSGSSSSSSASPSSSYSRVDNQPRLDAHSSALPTSAVAGFSSGGSGMALACLTQLASLYGGQMTRTALTAPGAPQCLAACLTRLSWQVWMASASEVGSDKVHSVEKGRLLGANDRRQVRITLLKTVSIW
ncbi:unnamed protein product [Protopolystoma xenopodis]|uniref:Uncharacterized protein n=1 Tax=Protopolystoma xenopodis TaxID=117903 RepID=A0A448WBJ8_9PLAT|nr:unnamed protein product [Protopolystoma xenopodis]